MRNTPDSTKKLNGLLRKLMKQAPPVESNESVDPVEVLVKSFLIWESTTTKATAAYKRIMDQVVDFNDLRVSMPDELVEWIGPRYPMALERCKRLRASLRDTFKREHAVNLDRLHGLGRREVKQYLRSLDGISPYAADRVTLLCFDAHCMPVDQRLRRALIKEGTCRESIEIADLSSWLARHVKAADGAVTHSALQAWSDRVGSFAPGGRSAGDGSPAGTTRRAAVSTKKKTAQSYRS